jgi:hypothetical protein
VPNARYTWNFENVASAARYLELNDMARKVENMWTVENMCSTGTCKYHA